MPQRPSTTARVPVPANLRRSVPWESKTANSATVELPRFRTIPCRKSPEPRSMASISLSSDIRNSSLQHSESRQAMQLEHIDSDGRVVVCSPNGLSLELKLLVKAADQVVGCSLPFGFQAEFVAISFIYDVITPAFVW